MVKVQAIKSTIYEMACRFHLVSSSSGVGMNSVEFIPIRYGSLSFLRLPGTLKLVDFDESYFMPILNASLASKLKAIHIYSNGYKIQELNESDFKVDVSTSDVNVPVEFTNEELADPWVRIRPRGSASLLKISFSNHTPKRLFESPTAEDSLASRRAKKDTRKQQT